MPHNNYRITQVREVILSANTSAEAAREANKLFDKRACYIHQTIKKEK